MDTVKEREIALIPGSRSWQEALKASVPTNGEFGFKYIWHHEFVSIATRSDIAGVYFMTFPVNKVNQQQTVFAHSVAEVDATLIVWGVHSDEWSTYQEWLQMISKTHPQEG